MTSNPLESFLPLFVPADRPERFVKATMSGADAVIIDLEDAVAAGAKTSARDGLRRAIDALGNADIPIFVRVNAFGSRWHDADIAWAGRLPIAGVMIPKAEDAGVLQELARAFGRRQRLVALVETAAGIANARALAASAGRLAFGSIDFAADVGCGLSRDALLLARLELVLASRLADLPGPIDGVTTAIDDAGEVEADARYAASLGFAGKLLIHPKQVAAAKRGFAPTEAEVGWAERVVAATADGAAVAIDGAMVDAPVLARARQILRRSKLLA
jgi:citrate lyase subunit beta / citryl-CoA lyase